MVMIPNLSNSRVSVGRLTPMWRGTDGGSGGGNPIPEFAVTDNGITVTHGGVIVTNGA